MIKNAKKTLLSMIPKIKKKLIIEDCPVMKPFEIPELIDTSSLIQSTDSHVCLDMTLLSYLKTIDFKNLDQLSGPEVYLFAPDDCATGNENIPTHRWNPFHYISRDATNRIGDIQVIANSLYPTSNIKEPALQIFARKLFTSLTLWMLDTEKVTGVTPTMPCLLDIAYVEGDLKKWMEREVKNNSISEECLNEFNDFISYPNETFISVLATFITPLTLFADPTVRMALNGNDFDFDDLRRKKIDIFVGIHPLNLKRFEPLITLFFDQLAYVNTRALPEEDPTLTHRCKLLLDNSFVLLNQFSLGKSITHFWEESKFRTQYNLHSLVINLEPLQCPTNENFTH